MNATDHIKNLELLADMELKLALLDGEAWAIKHVLEEKTTRDLIKDLTGGNSMSNLLTEPA